MLSLIFSEKYKETKFKIPSVAVVIIALRAKFVWSVFYNTSLEKVQSRAARPVKANYPVSILYKSISGRYRPVRAADGPITARYRFIKNASWVNNEPENRD